MLTARGITTTLEPIVGIQVLTAGESATSPAPAIVSIDPGTNGDAPVECTCIWTPGPGASPETTAGTIADVLAATCPVQARTHIRLAET